MAYIALGALVLTGPPACAREPAAEHEDAPTPCVGAKCDAISGTDTGTTGDTGDTGDAGDTGPSPPPDVPASDLPALPAFAGFEVEHYDYTFDLETERASSRLSIAVQRDGACLEIGMRTGAPSAVELQGEPTDFDFDGERLRVCADAPGFGDTIDLAVHDFAVPRETWRNTQVGYSSTLDADGQPFRYAQSWVGQCDRLGPCDARPDTFATYRFEVLHAPGTRVLCPGLITASQNATVCAFAFDGGPTYSTFAFAASPAWTEHDLGTWDAVQVTLYDLPSADLLGELDLPIHRAFLAWMETQFGPYPYGDEMRLFAAPLFWGGFEHPGNIVLDDGLFGGGFTQTLHHEIGHMWAGNQATLLSVHDFVWKEAMVEYLVFVFADEQPEPIAGRNKPLTWKAQGLNADFFPVPLEHPELLDFYSDVYSEGPMVLFRQTEALLGRDAVLQALASLLGKPGFHGIDDIRAALEAATGADLTEYFATWVVGEGRPARPTFDIEVAVPTAGDAVGITVRQQDPEDGLFGCAFAVELRGSAGQRHDAWIDLGPDGMSELVVEAEPGFVVESAAFDPQAHCLGRADVALVPTE